MALGPQRGFGDRVEGRRFQLRRLGVVWGGAVGHALKRNEGAVSGKILACMPPLCRFRGMGLGYVEVSLGIKPHARSPTPGSRTFLGRYGP